MRLITRCVRWIDDRTGLIGIVGRLARHPVPPGVGWRYVLGSATLLAFLLQVATGIALATVYVPSPSSAYQSLQYITQDAGFGRVLRGLHYFGASAMMILIGAHIARVYLTGSYKFPREVNWLSGVLLLGLTTLMAFTGQLLRWDQDAIWSEVVAAEQAGRVPGVGQALAHFLLGGDRIGGPTLTRSFAFHVFFIPALIFAGVGLHLYLVLRAGISEPPELSAPADPATYRAWYARLLEQRGRPFWPDVAWRDVVFGTGVIVIVAVLALTVGPAALGKPPDPTIVNATPRPDWYFLWYYALLAVLPHWAEPPVIVLAPIVAAVVLLLLPFVGGQGRHLRDRPWAIGIVCAIVGIVGWFWYEGQRAPWSPDFTAPPLAAAETDSVPRTASQDGARLFHDKGCEYCHTMTGRGGKRGPDLTDVAGRMNRAQLISRVLGGGGDMPAYAGNLTPDELRGIVDYLESRPGRGAAPAN